MAVILANNHKKPAEVIMIAIELESPNAEVFRNTLEFRTSNLNLLK